MPWTHSKRMSFRSSNLSGFFGVSIERVGYIHVDVNMLEPNLIAIPIRLATSARHPELPLPQERWQELEPNAAKGSALQPTQTATNEKLWSRAGLGGGTFAFFAVDSPIN